MIRKLTAPVGSATRRPETWLLALILFGFALRLGSIDFQSLWRDEVDAIRFGRDWSAEISQGWQASGVEGMLAALRTRLTKPGDNGPLYFLTLHQWSRAAGNTSFALRFFSAWFGVLAIPLTYILAKRLLHSAAHLGLLGAWLVTISPYFVWYSQEVKMYTEITALALAAIYALRRAIDAQAGRRAWPWWLLVVAATTLAMYNHIFAALLIGVEVALFALWWPQSKRHWRGGAIALAALTLPYLPLAQWQITQALTPGSQGFAFYSLDEMLRVMLSGFANGVLPFEGSLSAIGVRWNIETVTLGLRPANLGVGLFGALVVLGALAWKEANDRTQRLALAAWAILPAVAIWLVSLNRPVFTDRYLIWIGPAVYLLLTLGIAALWQWRKAIGVVAFALVTLAALVSVHAQAITPFKTDYRSAARYVADRYRGEAIVFQIWYGQHAFDYYFQPPFPIIEGPDTNWPNRAPESFDAEIANLLRGQPAVWLVATEVEERDNRHVLEGWLARYGRVTDHAGFMRIAVTRFELSP
jgi:4-amino-4-deoxy-L-arabinose transferase-like glycosyltransferase